MGGGHSRSYTVCFSPTTLQGDCAQVLDVIPQLTTISIAVDL